MNQFFIPRPFFKPPKAMEVLTTLELQDETSPIGCTISKEDLSTMYTMLALAFRFKYFKSETEIETEIWYLMRLTSAA